MLETATIAANAASRTWLETYPAVIDYYEVDGKFFFRFDPEKGLAGAPGNIQRFMQSAAESDPEIE